MCALRCVILNSYRWYSTASPLTHGAPHHVGGESRAPLTVTSACTMEASHARPRLGNAVLTVNDGISVLQPAGGDASADALFAYCKEHREPLRAAIFSENPLLVRGWDLSHV